MFLPTGVLDRIDQSEEGRGFEGDDHTLRPGRIWLLQTEHSFSLWRDADEDRTPDVHEWSDQSGTWVQDTRDYKGGSPRYIGPQQPRPEI